jgi:SAM-dependent methyltransferase
MSQYSSSARIEQRFMRSISLHGKAVLDVGCGLGGRAPYWLECGAARVIGIDINRQELDEGRRILRGRFPQYADHIRFVHPDDLLESSFADVAILVDVFEHLTSPAGALESCHRWLKPGGILWIGSIGWYHYLASHCLSHIPIPWCQILFSETAIIRTIDDLLHSPDYVPNVWERIEGIDRWRGIRTLKDRPGEPLNMLSLNAVRRVLSASPFHVTRFDVHGFSAGAGGVARSLSFLAKVPVAREMFHSYYTATLTRPASESDVARRLSS